MDGSQASREEVGAASGVLYEGIGATGNRLGGGLSGVARPGGGGSGEAGVSGLGSERSQI